MVRHSADPREVRFEQLKQQGLENYELVLHSLDFIKKRLAPNPSGASGDSNVQLLPFLELSRELESKNYPVRLNATVSDDGEHIEIELILPSDELVEYFVNVDLDPVRDDPLGVRSLCGILNYYHVQALRVNTFKFDLPAQRIDTQRPDLARPFRRSNPTNTALRELIDRALQGERVTLTDELYQAYCKMSPERQERLVERGLLLMRNDSDTAYELFVPQPPKQVSASKRLLNDIQTLLKGIEFRLEKGKGKVFTVTPEVAEYKVRQVFQLLNAKGILDQESFRKGLMERHIGFSPRTTDGELCAIEFHFVGERRLHYQQASMAEELPRRTITAIDFPPDLWHKVATALRDGRPQPVPNTRRNAHFLKRPETLAYLRQRGLSVNLSPLNGDGLFQKPVFIRADPAALQQTMNGSHGDPDHTLHGVVLGIDSKLLDKKPPAKKEKIDDPQGISYLNPPLWKRLLGRAKRNQ